MFLLLITISLAKARETRNRNHLSPHAVKHLDLLNLLEDGPDMTCYVFGVDTGHSLSGTYKENFKIGDWSVPWTVYFYEHIHVEIILRLQFKIRAVFDRAD